MNTRAVHGYKLVSWKDKHGDHAAGVRDSLSKNSRIYFTSRSVDSSVMALYSDTRIPGENMREVNDGDLDAYRQRI